MANKSSRLSWLLLSLAFTLLVIHSSASQNDRKAYIVYMGNRKLDEVSTSSLHTSMLQEVIGSTGPDSLIHSYTRSFNGFSAELTKQEAQKIAGMDSVMSVFPSKQKKLHTTRSWDFLGFPQQVPRRPVESNIIIGVFDTGIWPESESFSDEGFGPPPTKWKGSCQASANFRCNKKIIGARYYHSNGVLEKKIVKSPRDSNGHGTHTASTAAGNLVNEASLLGYGLGTARGGVPSARIAVYKVCWHAGSCDELDILKAFDDAIDDGVDIISLSVGGSRAHNYFEDAIAIGAFHAMTNGILTSVSAGNEGPGLSTLSNFSPWSLSVAASTIDRKFTTKIQLGNKKIYEGISINTFDLKYRTYPVIYGGDAPNTKGGFNGSVSRFCIIKDSLDQNLVKGKIVLCDGLNNGEVAFEAGAVGTIMHGPDGQRASRSFPLPASYLDLQDGSKLHSYITSARNPTVTILKSEEGNDTFAPYIDSFSSRGPNPVTFNILKPDLAAPGVNILAAWPPFFPITKVKGDNRLLPYNILLGTSMACPHATGAAAYIKSFHPTWSPAAIKSALMTTAIPMSAGKNPEAEFAYGAGNINPLRAPYPGLIYDIKPFDYMQFLCSEGYNTKLLQYITFDKLTGCFEAINGRAFDLNYPSFSLSTSHSKYINHVFHRTVTNVGSPNSTYKAVVTTQDGLRIKVKPRVLSFTSLGEKQPFTLKIQGTANKFIVSASLVWDDGKFQVRSPIVVVVRDADA
ncbi:cucumisin-like isoform X2 [Corylus avellana]|uniref:cucumisin-like isoform X2 n=1 Tax=Corylus avellana TaxID=13451 RepID=UPI00286CB2CE|nr:cucumisin-like isoform X2 [Corylus avellana]